MSLQITSAYEAAFPKTDVGVIEVKTLPAATLLMTRTDNDYFAENNRLFRPLFRYIQANEIPMTIPVEAEIDPGTMYFYVDEAHSSKQLENTDDVSAVELPKRTVLSLGVRGSYNEKNFAKARGQLIDYLAQQDDWVQEGSTRAVYWNGPFTIGFLKRSEVHIPIKKNK